ncbi:MAG: WD40 repeat domain-containing protein [Planctomycetes bacterium]|nr:WD40 repeat domain-containing protein [Planctomycetota bacterium]
MFLLRALLPFLLACTTALAQVCAPQWQDGDPVPYASGTVTDLVTWDPDGAGPEPQLLIAGGRFSAGTLHDVLVAAYDGVQWRPLGTPSGTSITAMTVWNGQLVVAANSGSFTSTVQAWNGTAWVPVGPFGSVAGWVRAFATFNSVLIAGGSFSAIGGASAANIAQFDGANWSSLGSGITGYVNALAWFSGALHVGGAFTNAGGVAVSNHAIWNGSAWFVGATFNGAIESLAVRSAIAVTQTYLFAGGAFTAVGPVSMPHTARLTQSTGLWTAMGAGIPCTGVADLFVRNVGLSSYELTAAVKGTSDEVWRWSGTTWSPLGALQDDSANAVPSALGYYGGYVVGLGGAAQAMRKYDGVQLWAPLLGIGLDERVNTSCSVGGDLVIGGVFRTISGVTMNGVARGNPGAWQPLGSGLEGGFGAFALLTMPNGDVLAAGSFTVAGGQPASYIARWNGASWAQFGGGTDDIVYSLALMPNGDVVAAGRFTMAGGVPCNRIARWNGVTWSPLGSGSPSQINALHVAPNGDLLVGGNFTSIGGVNANRIARWNGTWSAFGSGVDNAVWCVTTTGAGEVVIGGAFQFSGATSTPYIAKWNGSTWSPAGSTIAYHPDSDVYSVAVLPDGDLLACGAEWSWGFSLPPFSVSVAGNVARFDAGQGTWSALDVHGPFVQHLRVLPEGGFVVGGIFTAGGDSANFARLVPACPATTGNQGAGCAGATLTPATLPWVESTFRAVGTGLPTTAIVLTLTSVTSVPQGVAPLSIFFAQGLPGCDVLVAPDILGALVTTNGTAVSDTFLPNTPPFAGVTFYHQMIPIAVNAQGAWTSVAATNALRLTAGTF